MPKHSVEFPFSIADRVIIREIQRPGRVEAITMDALGIQFKVSFWDNSKRESTWLYADEIDPR